MRWKEVFSPFSTSQTQSTATISNVFNIICIKCGLVTLIAISQWDFFIFIFLTKTNCPIFLCIIFLILSLHHSSSISSFAAFFYALAFHIIHIQLSQMPLQFTRHMKVNKNDMMWMKSRSIEKRKNYYRNQIKLYSKTFDTFLTTSRSGITNSKNRPSSPISYQTESRAA